MDDKLEEMSENTEKKNESVSSEQKTSDNNTKIEVDKSNAEKSDLAAPASQTENPGDTKDDVPGLTPGNTLESTSLESEKTDNQAKKEETGFASRENPILGRKVFFLNPPLSICSFIMDNLKEEQFEVYSIPDYKNAKPVLRLFPNAICFIFIDDVMPVKGWYNFIQSFNTDDSLKSVFLGVISGRIKPKDKESFLMNLQLPGGFVSLGGAIKDVFTTIKGILDINGAKGCRKYVSLDCSNVTSISGYLADKFRLYTFKIKNISTAGIAIVMPANNGYKFQKNTQQDNICINLRRKTIVCSAIVYDVRYIGANCFAILLFTNRTTSEERTYIRNYVFEILQQQMNVLQNNVMPDDMNYAKEGEIAPVEKVSASKGAKDGDGAEAGDPEVDDNAVISKKIDMGLDELEDMDYLAYPMEYYI